MISQSLKINISDLLFSLDQKDFQITSMIADFDDEIKVKQPVIVNLSLARVDSKIITTGKMEAIITSLCSRCGEEFTKKRTYRLEAIFSKNPDQETDEWKIDKAGNIDLNDLLVQEIIINMPVKNLCDKCSGDTATNLHTNTYE